MRNSTDIPLLLGIDHPILQAPMAGGVTTPKLVAAVSNAGGLGSLAASDLSQSRILEAVAEIRERTDRPFNVNCSAAASIRARPRSRGDAGDHGGGHEELGMPRLSRRARRSIPSQPNSRPCSRPRRRSSASPSASRRTRPWQQPKAPGIMLLGTATTTEEARHWQRTASMPWWPRGARPAATAGTFLHPSGRAGSARWRWCRRWSTRCSVPVVAAGGIMDGRGIARRAHWGGRRADGTAFLTCREAGISQAYKAAVRAARDDET